MYFDSWQALWAMAGHGVYVWSAYAVTLVTLAALVWLPLQRKRRNQRWLRDFYLRQGDHSGDYEA